MKQTCIRIRVSAISDARTGGSADNRRPGKRIQPRVRGQEQRQSTLTLEAVKPVTGEFCTISGVEHNTCIHYKYADYPIAFEGRPGNGSTLRPGTSARFELKWGGNLTSAGDPPYQADLLYKIGTTGHRGIPYSTYITANESFCKVSAPTAGSCTAASLDLTFK